jgi:hypothetical protein
LAQCPGVVDDDDVAGFDLRCVNYIEKLRAVCTWKKDIAVDLEVALHAYIAEELAG